MTMGRKSQQGGWGKPKGFYIGSTNFSTSGDGSHPSWLMNLDAIAEGVVHIKAFARRWSAFLNPDPGRLQPPFQPFKVTATQTEMMLPVGRGPLFFYRKVQVQPSGIKPDATFSAQALGPGDFAQPQVSGIEPPCCGLPGFWHRDVDMREIQRHGGKYWSRPSFERR
jgi:hypothetical protein